MSWGRGSTGGLGNSGSASQEQEVPGNRYNMFFYIYWWTYFAQ